MMSRPFTRTRHAAVIAVLATLALTSACSFTRSAPVKDSYLLDPTWPAPAAKPQPGSLRMGAVTVAAPFRGRSFVLRDAELKYDTDFYHEFFVPPGVMIADATAQALARSKVFEVVSRPGVNVDADWVLDGFVGALYGDGRDAAKPMAVLQITYYLSRDDGGASSPVWSHTYAKRVPFAAGSTGPFVAALNTAFSEILAELTRDLAVVSLPAK
jgi:cholesterol transport system auxiliary component